MSNLLQLQAATKSFSGRLLFEEASFAINEGEHVGVIGPNGAGKTTLFKILVGQESLDRGQLVPMRGLRIGYLAQHDLWAPGALVEEFVSREARLPLWELKALGRGLGLEEAHFKRPMESLSGGYRTRIKLLQLLGQQPDLLLLDEPTNYLDLESVLVLENFLQETRGAFLLISHDREFLRRTTDHVLEVEGGEIIKYNGNLDDYFKQKKLLRAQLEFRALSQAEKRRQVMDFVNRFGASASRARQTQSRLKTLAKMETIEIKPLPNAARIRIPPPSHCGRVVLSIEDMDLGYGEKRVLRGVSLTLERGAHLAVVGVNGAGKSTLLKALAGKLAPLKGSLELGHEVRIGYFAQHVAEALDPNDTVLEAMSRRASRDVTSQQILDLAGSLLFSGDAVKKRVSVLSGGEKVRVALGQILLERSPLLVLDEPTNHLDFQTVEALTEALSSFEGTVVVVSHDRGFVRRVGTSILEVRDGKAEVYLGSYDEYVWSVQKGVLSARAQSGSSAEAPASKSGARSGTAPSKSALDYRAQKERERELRKLERDLAKLETKLDSLQRKVTELSEVASAKPLPAAFADLALAQSELDAAETAWLELGARRESLRSI